MVLRNKAHRYTDEKGNKYTSVTTIIGIIDKSGALIPWACRTIKEGLEKYVGKKISQEAIEEACALPQTKKQGAADVGTVLHDAIERFVKSGDFDELPHPQAQRCFNAFLDWCANHHVKFLATEKIVWSEWLSVAGTLDCLAEVDGVPTVIDWKTSGAIYPTHAIQVAAYAALLAETEKMAMPSAMVVRFGKDDGSFEAFRLSEEDMQDATEAFYTAAALTVVNKKLEKLLRAYGKKARNGRNVEAGKRKRDELPVGKNRAERAKN